MAYVQGYEVGYTTPFYVYGDKPRVQGFVPQSSTQISTGYNIPLSRIVGIPDFDNITGPGTTAQAFKDITSYREFNDGFVGESANTERMGKPYNGGSAPWTVYHLVLEKYEDDGVELPVDDEDTPTVYGGINTIEATSDLETFDTIRVHPTVINDDNKRFNGLVVNIPNTKTLKRGDIIGGKRILIARKIEPTPTGVVRPKYLFDTDRVEMSDFYGYNSVSRLGILSSEFFTEFVVVFDERDSGQDRNWIVGSVVIGEESNAVGQVEEGSTGNKLVLSSIVGVFKNGENIRQLFSGLSGSDFLLAREGGNAVDGQTLVEELSLQDLYIDLNLTDTDGNFIVKSGRIIRSGEVTSLEFDSKGPSGTDYDLSGERFITVFSLGAQVTLQRKGVTDGNAGYTYDADTNSLQLTESGRELLYNFPYANPQNSRQVPRVNYRVETENGVTGYAVVVPAKISNTLTKTKSLYSKLDDTPNFTADVSLETTSDVNNLTLADGSLFSGKGGNNYIICDDFLGDPSDQLVNGDLVTFTDDENVTQHLIVLFSTQPFGYGPTRVPGYIYFTTPFLNNVTGKRVERIRVKSFGKASENLIYQLPENVVSSLESDPQDTGISYQVYKEFVTDEIKAGETSVRITTNKPNEKFISDPFKTTIVLAKVSDRTEFNISSYEGRFIALSENNAISIALSGTEVTYKFKNPLQVDCVLKIIAPIEVTNAQAKRKNLIQDYQQSFPFDPENPRNAELSPLSSQAAALEKCDIFRLKSLMMTDGDGKQIDIKDNYLFDNGQRDGYYGLGQLILKEGRPRPTGNVIATYDYFQHEGAGDFFSVDSYLHDRGVSYGLIPVYRPIGVVPEANTDLGDISIKLRDCVDFRPILNVAPPNPSVLSITKATRSALDAYNFRDTRNGGDGFAPRIPIPNSQFECDVQFYLPKIDSLFLEKTGKMTLVEGIPSKNPVAPSDLSTGIRLYDLFMPAYTFNMKDIRVEKFNYRRYTMKDISEIDTRLDKVEDLVTLSILEISALNQSVRDAKTGLDRFKNGIIVDTFADHSKGNIGTRIYRNSIDFKQSHLRPAHTWDQIQLQEKNQTDENREIFGFYVNNKGIVTSPYDNVPMISQPKATKTKKVQRFPTFTFEGKVELSPCVDTFFDNRKIPDVTISDSKIWAAMSNIPADMVIMSLGTVWGSWENQARIVTNKSLEFGKEYQLRQNRVNNIEGSDFLYSEGISVGESSLTVGSAALSLQEARGLNKRQFAVNTGEPIDTSNGERVSDIQILPTMRTVPVYIKAERLKPKTRYYAFFDEVNVSDWVSVDTIEPETNYPDGVARYSGVPNSDPGNAKGFGAPLITDDEGNFQGVFLIPNGRPPVKGSKFFGNLTDVDYQVSGPTRSFKTGERYFRLTTSSDNSTNLANIEGFAEASFTSGSVIKDKSEFISSTRPEDYTTQTRINEQQTNLDQLLDSLDPTERPPSQEVSLRPRPRDPLAQTFNVDPNNPDGVFATELDLFFAKKDAIQGVEVYIVATDGETPSNRVLPHSRVVVPSSTTLRVICDLGDVSAQTLRQGITVRGEVSGTVGTVRNDVVFQSSSVNSGRNVENTVYDLVLSNYMNDAVPGAGFVPGETLIPQTNPPVAGTYTIAQDELQLERIDLVDLGSGYSLGETQVSPIEPLTQVEVDAPQLPGGVRAEASIKIAQSTTSVDNIEIERGGEGYSAPAQGELFSVFNTVAVDTASTGTGLTVACRVTPADAETNPGQITYAAPFAAGQGYKDGDRVRVVNSGSDPATISAILVVRLVEGKEGQIYEVQLTNPGSGYTKVPGVTFIDKTENDTLKPAKATVRVRSGREGVKMGVATSDDATHPTKFKFDAPVYLLGNATYAFVVKCPTSLDYELYTAKIGQKIIGTDTKVVTQPNTGAMFVSQNTGLWQARPNQDITFILHRANFKSNFTSNLSLINSPVSVRRLPPDPIETCNTLSLVPPRPSNPNSNNWEENDKIVKVYHPNHGLRSGDMVAIEGVDGGTTRTLGGINVDNINTLHQVIAADIDNFTIKLIQGATSSLKGGGKNVMGSYGRPYESINLYSGIQTFPSSSMFATNIATEAAGITLYNQDKQYTPSIVEDIPIMDTFYYDGAKQVGNYLNEAKYSQSDLLDGRRSLETNITFSSTDNKVSPVIDLQRTNMNVISNLVDRPEPNNVSINNIKRATLTGPGLSRDIPSGTPADFILKSGEVVTLVVDESFPTLNKITFVGSGVGRVANMNNVESVNFPGFNFDDALNDAEITITNNIEFLSEDFALGSVFSKWLSKQFVLENISDGIQVKMSAVLYQNIDIRLYYRPRFVGFDGDTSSINWLAFNPEQIAPGETRVDTDGNLIKTPGLPDNVETLRVRSSRNVDPRKIRQDEWQELTWSVQDISQFDAVSLKILMEAKNPAKCPIIDDIRVVVSE